MPANWDLIQYVNPVTHRVEWPTGPMNLHQGFAARWVDAWVVQGGAMVAQFTWPGSSQSAAQNANWQPGRWTAANPKWLNGSLQSSPAPFGQPALGISILASYNGGAGTFEYHWWLDVIVLRPQ